MDKTDKDVEIQKQLRANDKDALKNVYLEHRKEFLNYAKRYPLNDYDTMDIYQDATIAMHQNFVKKQIHLDASTVKTYLFSIAKYKIFDVLKQKKLLVNTDIKEDGFTEIELEQPTITQRQRMLSEKLNQISESCRLILQLFYYRNLTIDEIVELTDYKDGATVRSHKSRCIKRLKGLYNVVK